MGREARTAVAMVIGVLVADLLLGDVQSLKQKRAVVRPLLAALRRLDVAAAETGHLDLRRRAELSVSAVAAQHSHVVEVLDRCERFIAENVETTVLSTWRRILTDEDLP